MSKLQKEKTSKRNQHVDDDDDDDDIDAEPGKRLLGLPCKHKMCSTARDP